LKQATTIKCSNSAVNLAEISSNPRLREPAETEGTRFNPLNPRLTGLEETGGTLFNPRFTDHPEIQETNIVGLPVVHLDVALTIGEDEDKCVAARKMDKIQTLAQQYTEDTPGAVSPLGVTDDLQNEDLHGSVAHSQHDIPSPSKQHIGDVLTSSQEDHGPGNSTQETPRGYLNISEQDTTAKQEQAESKTFQNPLKTSDDTVEYADPISISKVPTEELDGYIRTGGSECEETLEDDPGVDDSDTEGLLNALDLNEASLLEDDPFMVYGLNLATRGGRDDGGVLDLDGLSRSSSGLELSQDADERCYDVIYGSIDETDEIVAMEELPAEVLPVEVLPIDVLPVEKLPIDVLPVEELPIDVLPVEELPVKELPVEELPIEKLSVEELPIEELPAKELHIESLPIEELPIKELPIEELLIKELRFEELPVKELPIKELPFEELPLEDISVERGEDEAVFTDTISPPRTQVENSSGLAVNQSPNEALGRTESTSSPREHRTGSSEEITVSDNYGNNVTDGN